MAENRPPKYKRLFMVALAKTLSSRANKTHKPWERKKVEEEKIHQMNLPEN
jgi:hypothetical protein